MESWYSFCYSPVLHHVKPDNVLTDEEFILWEDGDFGLCFEQVVISLLGFTSLALVSGIYCGIHHRTARSRSFSRGPSLKALITALLLVNSLVQLIGSFWLVRERPYAVLLSQVVEILCWLTHLVCLIVLSRSIRHNGYGPLPLNLAWALTLLFSVLHFRTSIQFTQFPDKYYNREPNTVGYLSLMLRIVSYVQFGLQCVYLVLLLVPAKHDSETRLIIDVGEHSTQYSSRVPLLGRKKAEELITSESVDLHVESPQIATRSLKQLTSEDKANPLSLLSFWWLTPLMRRGASGHLQRPSDLPLLPRALSTARIRETFQRILKRGQQTRPNLLDPTDERSLRSLDRLSQYSSQQSIPRVSINEAEDAEPYFNVTSSDHVIEDTPLSHIRTSTTPFSLIRALNRAFGLHYYPLGLMKLMVDCLGFAGPLLLHQLVGFMENRKEPISHGYYYALGMFLSTLLGALLNAHFTFQMNKVGLKIRASLVTEIFRKTLSVSSVSMSKFSTGEVVDFMSTDADRIVNFCSSFHQFWSLPFQIAVSLYLLYLQVGLAFLAGLVFTILLIPINRWLAVKIGKLSTAMMSQKDRRVKLMSEILNGIRVIKFYAWEGTFASKINRIRNEELLSLRGRKYLDALCVYFWATTPVLISILTFSTYAALGHKLTAAKVFTSIALFNMLISPLNAFPWVLNGLVESWVSLKRVQRFLQMEELDFERYYLSGTLFRTAIGPVLERQDGNELVCIVDGCFTWRRNDSSAELSEDEKKDGDNDANSGSVEWLLDGINLTIRKGEFVGITGKVGSGKSSVLSAVMADMKKKRGQVFVANLSEGFAYVSQESWIQFASVRDNILFGLPFDAERYAVVIKACALEQDLQILPAGDMTEVGENGVTLSGGQKARLALARAVYQDKEVYFLDDPLAAVDAHVAHHLFTHCIMGLLRQKTRVLCTHHTKFLQQADLVIVFEEGAISMSGSPNTVLPAFEGGRDKRRRRSFNARSSRGNETEVLSEVTEDSDGGVKSDSGVLVKEEEKEEGVVKFSVYQMYWQSVGVILTPLILISLFLMQASRNISDWWLAYWISHTQDGYPDNITLPMYNIISSTSSDTVIQPMTTIVSGSDYLPFYLGIYGGLALSNSVFTLFRAFLYAYGGIVAARNIHKRLLMAILSAPVSFFDITPIGRILNRFSSDLYAIDDSLPFIMNILLAQVYGLLGTLIITCYGLPWFLVVLVPLTVLYYYIQKYYRRTSRELKRLSTVTLSPIYAHFQETIMGLSTIRAMRASDRFMLENERRLELNQRANYAGYCVGQWLSLRLQMLGVAMVAGVSFIAVLEHHFATVDPGLVGLAISYALSVTSLLSGVVTSFTETEKEMVSVERGMQYIEGAPKEDVSSGYQTMMPSFGWPDRGEIEFRNVVMRYRESLPPSLRGVSFVIKPSEKVGVVGRTGAGKTSLLQALFRMVGTLVSGTIIVDGVDTTTIPLKQLRSSMAVIPQDPFLFAGSVRENLDPCSKFSDMELWSALARCNLKVVIEKIGGLNAEVEERGRVFSAGQKQLMCLCRALLTSAKIICIDEATASVDMQTDKHIQQAIRLEFVNSTVITIAHRIDTVLNCDRILVMDSGRVCEFNSPGVLLGDSDSHFSSLFNEHVRNR